MFFCTVYACIYVVVLFENVVVNVSDRFERCWDSDVLLSHAEIFPQSSFLLMFHLVLMKLVVGCYITLLLYSEYLQNAFLSDVFALELPSMPRVREDLCHTSACDRGKLFLTRQRNPGGFHWQS